MAEMKVFICTDHDTFWPVGGASVVLANDEAQAKSLLDAELAKGGLRSDVPYTLEQIGQDGPMARVLNNGDY